MKPLWMIIICIFLTANVVKAQSEEAEEAHHSEGLKLSETAQKNFGIQTLELKGKGPWRVPASAKLVSREEINLYRLRDGVFSRIDFETLSSSTESMDVKSHDLREGDRIVISGVAFVRIAEIATMEDVPTGHSH